MPASSSMSISAGKAVASPRAPAASRASIVSRHLSQRPQLSGLSSRKQTLSHGSRSGRFRASQATFAVRVSGASCSTSTASVENSGSSSGLVPHGPIVAAPSLDGMTT
jgi:hypothetical protein